MSEPFGAPIDGSTRFCAVFGQPVKHSASPAFQNAAIAVLGLNWRYLAFEVHPDRLRAALDGALAMGFIGVNLTVPHKLSALDKVHVLDESARTWGAVNTILFEGRDSSGQWQPVRLFEGDGPREVRARGFNTDAEALSRSVREDLGLQLTGASVLLLGVGGAGRTAALKLAADGVAALFVVNRSVAKAEAVAAEIRRRFPDVRMVVGYPKQEVDLLLNATSLGLKCSDPLPLDQQLFALDQARTVYDLIYRPARTRLLEKAEAVGCRIANGLGMLVHQGAAALEIWSGQRAPIPLMRSALEKELYGN